MAWNHNPKPASGIPASGTPKGGNGSKGPGFGPGAGPAQPYTADSPTRGDAKLDNGDPAEHEFRAAQRVLKRELARKAWQNYKMMLEDPTHAKHYEATRDVLNRTEGMPTQKTVLTGEDDGPVKIETIRRVIVDPVVKKPD